MLRRQWDASRPESWLNMLKSHIGLQKTPLLSACGSKTAFMPIFGHNMLNTVPLSVLNWQKVLPGALKWTDSPKTAFCPYLVMWWPSLLTRKFSEMLNTFRYIPIAQTGFQPSRVAIPIAATGYILGISMCIQSACWVWDRHTASGGGSSGEFGH